MSMKRHLLVELQQGKPFETLYEEVYVEILRTSQVTSRWITEALKPSELSGPQFNVLRILRGAGSAGLPSGRIAERMVNHDPDLTRLLDRLEARGLVEKARDTKDRRVVNACITKAGLDVVAKATKDMQALLEERMTPMSAKRLEQLADLLEEVRDAGGNDEQEPGSRSRHGSDGAPGRRGGARADRAGREGARHDAQAGRRRREGAVEARDRNRRG
jgi:DNA-binding MarR family transcriptional regulator